MSTELAMALDAITADALRRKGSSKWSTFPDCLGAFIAEMDFGIAPEVREALDKALDRGLTGYMPRPVERELQAQTAELYSRRFSAAVDPEHVKTVPDVIRAFEITLDLFMPPGAAVVVPTPAYPPFLAVPRERGHRVIEVPSIEASGRWLLDLERISAELAAGAGLVALCNPHNPTGTVYGRDELVAFSEVVSKHGARVFSDEIHAPITYGAARHIPYFSCSSAAADHTITAISASKGWNLAGLACAEVILSNPRDADRWASSVGRRAHGASTLGAVATIAAFRDAGEWLADTLAYLEENRDHVSATLAEDLPEARVHRADGTYLSWVDLRAYGLPDDLGRFFRERAEIAVIDGADCGEAGRGCIRLNYATPRPVLAEILRRLVRAVRAHRRSPSSSTASAASNGGDADRGEGSDPHFSTRVISKE